jgi:tetratricopeptide (TPR) repeat protein
MSAAEYNKARSAVGQEADDVAITRLIAADKYSPCNVVYESSTGMMIVRALKPTLGAAEWWHANDSTPLHENEGLSRATSFYRKAAACAPMDAAIHSDLAALYADSDDGKDARMEINRAIELEPYTATYRIARGLLSEQRSDDDAANVDYAMGIALSPAILDSQFFADFKKRHPSRVEYIYGQSLADAESFPATPMRDAVIADIIYFDTNNPSVLASDLTQVTLELPSLSKPWARLGGIAEASGDLHQAIIDYRRALFLDPLDTQALSRAASIDHALGDDEAALETATTAIMLRQSSEHASRSSRMYGTNPLFADDLLPLGLATYIEPKLAIDDLCSIVREASSRRGVIVPEAVKRRIVGLGGHC